MAFHYYRSRTVIAQQFLPYETPAHEWPAGIHHDKGEGFWIAGHPDPSERIPIEPGDWVVQVSPNDARRGVMRGDAFSYLFAEVSGP